MITFLAVGLCLIQRSMALMPCLFYIMKEKLWKSSWETPANTLPCPFQFQWQLYCPAAAKYYPSTIHGQPVVSSIARLDKCLFRALFLNFFLETWHRGANHFYITLPKFLISCDSIIVLSRKLQLPKVTYSGFTANELPSSLKEQCLILFALIPPFSSIQFAYKLHTALSPATSAQGTYGTVSFAPLNLLEFLQQQRPVVATNT